MRYENLPAVGTKFRVIPRLKISDEKFSGAGRVEEGGKRKKARANLDPVTTSKRADWLLTLL